MSQFLVMCAAAACPEGFYFVFLAATISVLLLSWWETHHRPKPAGRSLCRLSLIVSCGKTPWFK